jgi:hypothetical protein
MERHHRWLVDPPAGPPAPEELGARDIGGRYRWPHSDAERAYRAAAKHWSNYQAWLRDRNPARAELEARYGYDTKHAMHLLRLLRVGEEILREGVVRVLRPDAEWLLAVRNGALTYDHVLTYAAEHKARLAATIAHSPLPEEPDEQAADRLLIELQTEYLFGSVERVRQGPPGSASERSDHH